VTWREPPRCWPVRPGSAGRGTIIQGTSCFRCSRGRSGASLPGSLREAIAGSLHRAAGTVLEVATADGLEEPRLDTPAVVTVLRAAGVPGNVRPTIRSTVHDALCAAASARVHGVLRERRRRRYGHAALLVACCVELDTDRAVRWAADLRERTRRFPAFRAALDESLGGVKA